jgi:hypothetical protein
MPRRRDKTPAERAAHEERRTAIGNLIKRARTDADMRQVGLAAVLFKSDATKPMHKNSVQNWEKGEGYAERYFRRIEDATGKPRGWFERQLDPIGWMQEMADDIAAIRKAARRARVARSPRRAALGRDQQPL